MNCSHCDAVTCRDLANRVKRLEALLPLLLAKQRLSAGRLVQAISEAANGDWFVSGHLWRMAEAERLKAEVNGDEIPELSQALELEGIKSAHGLGRWIASQPSGQFERGAEERGGLSWRACGFSGDETA